jgi:TRAP-type mannitol/chloroaromatic compound transport system permease small subunit
MLQRLALGIGVIGRLTAWASLLMVLGMCATVILRYGFSLSFVALQEAVMYLHAALFMLGAAYTLQQDGHVRIDIFQRNFSPRGRAWVELLGVLGLLWPLCAYMLFSSWGYVLDAWMVRESSREPGGLPGVFILKSLLLLLPLLLALQGLIQAHAAWQVITKKTTC